MSNIPHIVSKVYGEPWAILPDVHRSIRAAVEAKLRGDTPSPIQGIIEEPDEADPVDDEGVAIIPVHGIIGKHLSSLEMLCGGCDLDAVCRDIEMATEDDGIEIVGFDFRSPGGTVTGTPEAADAIAELAKLKTVFAFTDDCCCSAAYWMASQCPTIFTSRSAVVGSIGVIAVYADESRALANQGIGINEFRSGRFKGMGASYRQMTDEEKAMLGARVEKIGSEFRAVVASSRGIKPEDMEGQWFDGATSAEKGFADEVVSCIEDAIEMMRS